MRARVLPHSGLRSWVCTSRSSRTPVDAFVDSNTAQRNAGEPPRRSSTVGAQRNAGEPPRRSSTVGSIGNSMFRRFRRASAPSVLETENYTQQPATEKSEFRPVFPSGDESVRHLLEDIFNSTCEMAPPALAAEVRTRNSSFLQTVFSHLQDTCQDCLCVDSQNRLKIVCSLMTRWTNDAQKALASALGEKEARGHDTELIVFALQLKLQAGLRLMNEEYVRSMLHKQDHTDARTLGQTHSLTKGSLRETSNAVQDDTNAKCMAVAKTKRVHFEKVDSKATSATNVSTSSLERNPAPDEHVEPDAEPSDVESPIARHMDLECMGIEASSAVNAEIFRAARADLARTRRTEESELHDAPRRSSQEVNMEASSAINASIFRAQRNRSRKDEEKHEAPHIDAQDLQIDASATMNAAIFSTERKRLARRSDKKRTCDLQSRDVSVEASCALNAAIFQAERSRLARESGEGRNIKPRTQSSPSLLAPDFLSKSSADSKVVRSRPASLDDDVCGRELRQCSIVTTPKFSVS